MIPTDQYIGLSNGLHATCDGQVLTLLPSVLCPSKQRLCTELSKLEDLERSVRALQVEKKTLDQLLALAKPTQIDASRWIDAAAKIGTHQAEIDDKLKQLSRAQHSAKMNFERQAPTREAVIAKKRCVGELELTIPAGYIGAKLLYEADSSDPHLIGIKQFIALTNRSGIDIVAKEADIYTQSYHLYLRPQQFSPWIAQIVKPVRKDKKVLRKEGYAKAKAINRDSEYSLAAAVSYAAPAAAPETNIGAVVETGYRNYHVSGIELPSTGEEIRVKIADYKVAAECELVTYPYRDSRVYRACSFTPKSPIESNKWHIRKNKRVISDRAYGSYRDGKYLLNVDMDDTILVVRRPMVKRDRSSGIFGGSIRKKDGYTLKLTNLSDKVKRLKIIERIPTSATDKIKSKLLDVEGASSYRLLKEGELEIILTLSPHAHQEIRVLFELSYNKDTKVSY